MTMRERCEVICRYLKEDRQIECQPTDIWNMSPSGELWPVLELYRQAEEYFRHKERRNVEVSG
jgi:hypothetical protein